MNSISTINTPSVGWCREECTKKKVKDLIVEKFIAIVRDGHERMTNYKSTGAASKGFWYANNNYLALKEIEKEPQPRLNALRRNGNFFHGFPPKGFNSVSDKDLPTGKRLCGYVLKEDVLPSEGLKSAKESFSFIDCQEAMEIAYYDAFLEIMGEKRFNEYFSPRGKHPFCLDTDLTLTPLNDFFKSLVLSHLKKGDQVYFSNIPFYTVRHLHGEAMGYHSLCIEASGEPIFTAFGLSPEGVTEEGMYDVMVEDFNATPLAGNSIVTDELLEKINASYIRCQESNKMHRIAATYVLDKEKIKSVHTNQPSLAGLRPIISRVNIKMVRLHMLSDE